MNRGFALPLPDRKPFEPARAAASSQEKEIRKLRHDSPFLADLTNLVGKQAQTGIVVKKVDIVQPERLPAPPSTFSIPTAPKPKRVVRIPSRLAKAVAKVQAAEKNKNTAPSPLDSSFAKASALALKLVPSQETDKENNPYYDAPQTVTAEKVVAAPDCDKPQVIAEETEAKQMDPIFEIGSPVQLSYVPMLTTYETDYPPSPQRNQAYSQLDEYLDGIDPNLFLGSPSRASIPKLVVQLGSLNFNDDSTISDEEGELTPRRVGTGSLALLESPGFDTSGIDFNQTTIINESNSEIENEKPQLRYGSKVWTCASILSGALLVVSVAIAALSLMVITGVIASLSIPLFVAGSAAVVSIVAANLFGFSLYKNQFVV